MQVPFVRCLPGAAERSSRLRTLACVVLTVVLIKVVLADTAVAVDPPAGVLVGSDGRRQPARLIAIHPDRLVIDGGEGDASERSVPWSEVLRFGPELPGPAAIDAPASVWLVDGSRLAASRITIKDLSLEIENPWSRALLPIDSVVAVQINGPLSPAATAAGGRLLESLDQDDAAQTEDALVLLDGQVRRGGLAWHALEDVSLLQAAQQDREVALQRPGQTLSTSLARVRWIVTGTALRATVESKSERSEHNFPELMVQMRDGSRLVLGGVSDPARWRLACGVDIVWNADQTIHSHVQAVAPAVVDGLLARAAPLRYRAVPWFGSPPPLHRETTPLRNRIETAATSRLVYSLDRPRRLRGRVVVRDARWAAATSPSPSAFSATDDSSLIPACRFTVQTVDAQGTVTTRWQSDPVGAIAGENAVDFDVVLPAAGLLILGSDSASGGDLPVPQWRDVVWYEAPAS
ncbi:hypothetical protein [Roseimaritima sediminicola]|uniref:hypothetical protein n=1 Tax=Roseimaritima sediminicola TaxID=2662066 RepID=UPI0012985449|nr:hypothetical protein [Roseimaritima sediminicola]